MVIHRRLEMRKISATELSQQTLSPRLSFRLLFSSLKYEMYLHRTFTHCIAARTAVMKYIESWYTGEGRPQPWEQPAGQARALSRSLESGPGSLKTPKENQTNPSQ